MADASWAGGFLAGGRRFAVDGNYTILTHVGPPRITFPFEGDSFAPSASLAVLQAGTNTTGFKYTVATPAQAEEEDQSNSNGETFIIEQDFMIAADYFQPEDLNTLYNAAEFAIDYQGSLVLERAVLVHESSTQDCGNGLFKWTRTYATVPKTRNTYESFQFNFPGVSATVVAVPRVIELFHPDKFETLSDGSPELSLDVVVRVEKKYFLLGAQGGLSLVFSPNSSDPASDFYIVPQFRVFFNRFANQVNFCSDFSINSAIDFKSVDDDSPQPPPSLNTIPPSNTNGPGNEDDSGVGYQEMVDSELEICAKASVIRQWRGNIYEKTTLYTIAQ